MKHGSKQASSCNNYPIESFACGRPAVPSPPQGSRNATPARNPNRTPTADLQSSNKKVELKARESVTLWVRTCDTKTPRLTSLTLLTLRLFLEARSDGKHCPCQLGHNLTWCFCLRSPSASLFQPSPSRCKIHSTFLTNVSGSCFWACDSQPRSDANFTFNRWWSQGLQI